MLDLKRGFRKSVSHFAPPIACVQPRPRSSVQLCRRRSTGPQVVQASGGARLRHDRDAEIAPVVFAGRGRGVRPSSVVHPIPFDLFLRERTSSSAGKAPKAKAVPPRAQPNSAVPMGLPTAAVSIFCSSPGRFEAPAPSRTGRRGSFLRGIGTARRRWLEMDDCRPFLTDPRPAPRLRRVVVARSSRTPPVARRALQARMKPRGAGREREPRHDADGRSDVTLACARARAPSAAAPCRSSVPQRSCSRACAGRLRRRLPVTPRRSSTRGAAAA